MIKRLKALLQKRRNVVMPLGIRVVVMPLGIAFKGGYSNEIHKTFFRFGKHVWR